MHFGTLQHTSLQIIADTFNLAFSDYVIPMHFTEVQLIEKLTRDGIHLEHSVGAFDGDKLVGFILQGLGPWEGALTAYNGGTGVIPDYRGQKLTQQLYAYSIPQLKAAGVKQCLLEVVTRNLVALKTYKAIGFNIARTLESYKGELNMKAFPSLPTGFIYREVIDLDWELAESFWDCKPSWGYNFAAIQRIRQFTQLAGIYYKNNLVGYGAIHENTNRMAQFAIAPAYRRQGLGLHLFQKLAAGKTVPLSVINVDEKSESTLNFLEDIGLTAFLQQYEMTLAI
ncbi:GNAT family N-acetyltransferase [Adhaeribacter rhizoryzae]|uniref:GNAT family N-acetyltransferase n=1 Tax=Adhaeribacter rhizoryzae TaxID=2607907 RepID=A0A5M6DK51_9BACT|nr:GNAT family N-acetyltransferase [Adhaeribacter rhizoryzae]KAA5547924.1 GNAT family N-acetyltransferase [Adhaeribacter rhizoryzae]